MSCGIEEAFVSWGAPVGVLALAEPFLSRARPGQGVVTIAMVEARLAALREDVQLLLPLVSSGLSYRERFQPD